MVPRTAVVRWVVLVAVEVEVSVWDLTVWDRTVWAIPAVQAAVTVDHHIPVWADRDPEVPVWWSVREAPRDHRCAG
uniref:Putative secreted protein n=1 Tax=Anopheles triannulatus TaxID=58253 RepID=A0A2M4B651_9DIPT